MPIFGRNILGQQLIGDFGIEAFEPSKPLKDFDDEVNHGAKVKSFLRGATKKAGAPAFKKFCNPFLSLNQQLQLA